MNLPTINGKYQVTKCQHTTGINYYASKHYCTIKEATEIMNREEIVTDECEKAWELAYLQLELGKLRTKYGI